MNANTNLPPDCLVKDVDGPRDMAAAMDAFFERLDRREQERRDDFASRRLSGCRTTRDEPMESHSSTGANL